MNDKIFTKNLLLLIAINFMGAIAFMQLIPLLPLYATQEAMVPQAQVGLVIGAFSIASLLGRPFIGYIVDNYNKHVIMMIALVLLTCALFCHIWATTMVALIMVRMVLGVGWSSTTTNGATIATSIIPVHRRGEGLGFYMLASPMAMVIGPALSVEINELTHNFTLNFAISGTLGFLALVLSLFIKIPAVQHEREPFQLNFSSMFEKRVLGMSFMQFCYSVAYSGVVTYIPLYIHEGDMGRSSAYFTTFAIFVIISRMFARKTLDTKGPTKLVVIGYTSFFIGLLCLSNTESWHGLVLTGMFLGLAGGIVIPLITGMSMNVAHPEHRGKANATTSVAMDVGTGVGAVLWGYISAATSFSFIYMCSSFIVLIPIIYYFAFGKKKYLAYSDEIRKHIIEKIS